MNNRERLIEIIKLSPNMTSIELYNSCDCFDSLKDLSSTLSALYKDGRLDRKSVLENKRHTYRYTFRSDTPAKNHPKTVSEMAKSKLDTMDKVSNKIDAMPKPNTELLALANAMLSERLKEIYKATGNEDDSDFNTILESIKRRFLYPETYYVFNTYQTTLSYEVAKKLAEELAMDGESAFIGTAISQCKIKTEWEIL